MWAAFAAVLGINLYFRLFPAYFPQLKQTAANVVLKGKLDEISRDIGQRFAGLSESAQSRLIDAQFEQYKRANAQSLAERVEEEYARQKDRYQDKRGQTYMMELDGWSWARYVDNILRTGKPWDELRDGKGMDMRMLYPGGADIGWSGFLIMLLTLKKRGELLHSPPSTRMSCHTQAARCLKKMIRNSTMHRSKPPATPPIKGSENWVEMISGASA